MTSRKTTAAPAAAVLGAAERQMVGTVRGVWR
jgi:hypothetical protein